MYNALLLLATCATPPLSHTATVFHVDWFLMWNTAGPDLHNLHVFRLRFTKAAAVYTVSHRQWQCRRQKTISILAPHGDALSFSNASAHHMCVWCLFKQVYISSSSPVPFSNTPMLFCSRAVSLKAPSFIKWRKASSPKSIFSLSSSAT